MLHCLLTHNIELFGIVSSSLNLNDLEALSRVCKDMHKHVSGELLNWYRMMRPVCADINAIKYTDGNYMSIRNLVTYSTILSGPKNYLLCVRGARYHTIYEDVYRVYSTVTKIDSMLDNKMSLDSKYTTEQIDLMRSLAGSPHVSHCLWQMWRFAHLANTGGKFREGQFCYNMGRAQELLKMTENVSAWWRLFEPLIIEGDYPTIMKHVREYHDMLSVEYPTTEFINK